MEKKSFKDTGLHLLKKGQKGLVHAIFSRFGVIILLFAIQAIILLSVLIIFQSFAPEFFGGGLLIGLGVSLHILNTRIDPTAKLTWVILVMALPILERSRLTFLPSRLITLYIIVLLFKII